MVAQNILLRIGVAGSPSSWVLERIHTQECSEQRHESSDARVTPPIAEEGFSELQGNGQALQSNFVKHTPQ